MAVHGGQFFLSELTLREITWNQRVASLPKSFAHLKRVCDLQCIR